MLCIIFFSEKDIQIEREADKVGWTTHWKVNCALLLLHAAVLCGFWLYRGITQRSNWRLASDKWKIT